jgi:hypothetical protein
VRKSARAQEGGGGTSSHKFSFPLPHLFGEHGGRWTPALLASVGKIHHVPHRIYTSLGWICALHFCEGACCCFIVLW